MTKDPQLSDKDRRAMLDAYRVTSGKKFKLSDHPTKARTEHKPDKKDSTDLLADGVQQLSELQDLLYANSTWSLLIVFQAMDAAGKDSTIKHVMSGVNPQGVGVTSFKQPSSEELAHDFLWRVHKVMPARGMIGIFNRSHYEEVLVTRVHPEILNAQHLPSGFTQSKRFWEDRLTDIANFENHLVRQGTKVVKFFLNVGRDEQKQRFLARLDEPEKNWKFSANDVVERGYWDRYMAAYEATIGATASEAAPWFVVPADQKWYARLVVVSAINEALASLDLKPVQISDAVRKDQAEARRKLETET